MRWSSIQNRASLRLLKEYGKAHQQSLRAGLFATVLVVLIRLALPWPLRWIIELVVQPEFAELGSNFSLQSPWAIELLWLTAGYVALAIGLGYAELRQRVAMKQYAASTVHSIREAAVEALMSQPSSDDDQAPDTISRVISDAARIKAELSGILLHASQNGLLYVGISVVFLYLSPTLGLFFVAGGILTVLLGLNARNKIAPISLKQREKEGEYASVVQSALTQGYLDEDSSEINQESARRDVRTTRLMARTTWMIHIVLSIVIAASLWVAIAGVAKGSLLPGELFLFMAYVLTVHRRMVQVGRQLSRSGKLIANLTRLGEVIRLSSEHGGTTDLGPLQNELELRNVSFRPVGGSSRSRVLNKISFKISAGEKIALLGHGGSGKSTLLRAFAGQIKTSGSIVWDGIEATRAALQERSNIRYLPRTCVFRRRGIASFLNADMEENVDAELVAELGLKRFLRNASNGLRTKVSSAMLTRREARSLVLYNILSESDSSTWILDAPTEDLSLKKTSRRISIILSRAGNRTVIASLPFAKGLEGFDRVLVLRKGRIAFDGTVEKWSLQRREAREL